MSLSEILAEKKELSAKNIPADKLAIMQASTNSLKKESLASKAIKVGEKLPSFKLLDVDSKVTTLESFKSKFLVVSFYRGGWCPYCNLELKALQKSLPELKALKADLIAISPETPDNSLTTSQKNDLSFAVLSDFNNVYAKSLGLVFKMSKDLQDLYYSFNLDVEAHNGNQDFELPMPATYIVNEEREIIYSFTPEDYTERLDPEVILKILKEQ